MRLIMLIMSIVVMSGCNHDDGDIYSFDKIIELRLKSDESIDGKEVKISSLLSSSFTLNCIASINPPCVNVPENEDLSMYQQTDEYGHSNNGTNGCGAGNIRLLSWDSTESEVLGIDYNEHSEFYLISEDKEVRGQFRAKVEFTDEVDYCSKKIYKGTKITLSDGEHQKILNLFVDPDN
jgi:hypothetical protein